MATAQKTKSTPAAPADKPSFSLISNEKLIQLYSTMVKCRMLEEHVREIFTQGRIVDGYDATAGLEATVVGTSVDLKPGDTLGASHRDFIARFVKGAPLKTIFRELIKNAKAPAIPERFSAIIASAAKHKATKKGGIAIAFASDGDTAQADWEEALETAGKQGLPIIFVDRKRPGPGRTAQKRANQPGAKTKPKPEDISAWMKPFGFPRIVVDSSDVVAAYRVAHESISRARKGRGPALIECVPFEESLRPKTDSVKNGRKGKQKQKPYPNPILHDPIANMEAYLTRKGLFAPGMKVKIADSFSKELDAAIRSASSPRRAAAANVPAPVQSSRVRKPSPAKKS